MENQKQSPLKDRPLRVAGQSADEQIQDVTDDAMAYVMCAVMVGVLAIMEWFRWFTGSKPQPLIFTVFAVAGGFFAAWKFRKGRSELRLRRQGRDGERMVAEELDKLRAQGYRVLHDLVAGNFNIDHVLIGPAGIFAVETKTWSKGRGAAEKILFDGTNILRRGKRVFPNPTEQASANAKWLRDTLEASTARQFKVTPIVTFPGWFVESSGRVSTVIVSNPKMIAVALQGRPVVLDAESISMATFHLERFIRTVR